MNGKKIIAIISVLFIFTVCTVSGAGGDNVDWSSPTGYIAENTNNSQYITQWKNVKHVNNPSDFSTILYRQDLWPRMVNKFNDGAAILKINIPNGIKPKYYSPFTNSVNGIPQWILPKDNIYSAELIKELEKIK